MEEDNLITKDNARVVAFFESLDRMLDDVEYMARNCRPTLRGERFLTDKELAQRLRVSRRTLQEYRTNGQIAYILLGGKVLYRESDIEKMLNEAYKESLGK